MEIRAYPTIVFLTCLDDIGSKNAITLSATFKNPYFFSKCSLVQYLNLIHKKIFKKLNQLKRVVRRSFFSV